MEWYQISNPNEGEKGEEKKIFNGINGKHK